MEIVNEYEFAQRAQTVSEIDYVQDGVLHICAPSEGVMVESEDQLEGLPDYRPGTIAFTAGFKKMWQLGADGTWEAIIS